jgi:PilZ domain-containing protein
MSTIIDLEAKRTTISWLTASGERHTVAAEAFATADGVRAELAEPVATGQTVWVAWEPAVRRAFVKSCEAREDRYILEISFLAQERRREDRLPAVGSGTLHWSQRSQARTATVEVEDVTESGVRVRAPEPVAPGEMIRLTGENWECLGRVHHCQTVEGASMLGIELTGPAYQKDALDYVD